jgi:hypothetical protein
MEVIFLSRTRTSTKDSFKTAKTFLESLFLPFFFFLSLYLIIYGLSLHSIGFHNMDLGHNINFLECAFDTKLQDTGNDFKVRNSQELIMLGDKQMTFGLRYFGAGMLLLGLTTSPLLGFYKKKKIVRGDLL